VFKKKNGSRRLLQRSDMQRTQEKAVRRRTQIQEPNTALSERPVDALKQKMHDNGERWERDLPWENTLEKLNWRSTKHQNQSAPLRPGKNQNDGREGGRVWGRP